MKIKELIAKLISEGKSDAEIAKAVMGEAKDFSASDIAEKILEAKKEAEVLESLKADSEAKAKVEADKKATEEVDAKVKSQVDAHLKSINFDPAGNMSQPKSLKRFDASTGKVVDVRSDLSDAYKGFNDMLIAITEGDKKRAKSISNEIEQDNKALALSSKAANDPLTSDGSGVDGSGAIPTEVDMEISQLVYEKSVMLDLANTDNIIFNSKIYPLMYGIAVADIADEATAITEDAPAIASPTVSMKKAGTYANISNTMIIQKGTDVVNAFQKAYATGFAEFLDTRLAIGNVTNASNLVDGIVFDPNTNAPTAFALSALTVQKLADIKNALSDKATGRLAWVGNRKVTDKIGLLENTNGAYVFPGYVNGGKIAPLGIPLMTNSKITSVLDIGGDASTGGTDDVLILADFSHVIAGISEGTRIDLSTHWRFTNDVTTIRAIKRYGQEVLSSSSTGGIVAIAQELTN